ncbi:MAG: Uma2 family endonuclease, partial [Gemmatimonadota bacterium]|nr:Uma2 family endonuclease [Gemmatimonadota bacterium]
GVYLKLGVAEVWLVDPREETIEVRRRGEEPRTVSDVLRWTPPNSERELSISLNDLFRDFLDRDFFDEE